MQLQILLFVEKLPTSLLLIVCGPFMLQPTIEYNNRGNAFWLMEEYFIVPLQRGFVFSVGQLLR